ncbi:TIGR00153 family protein [Salinisphaera sp. USBA-960]|uniref:TIGR00153 family protein n=1 Tax=Salinisphaera orenii TaxID=856731 RepID=UPI000DBEA8BE|nr:TIGR00153 family protein [Salifodinibacter halophilus]NNC25419.1 TIGR00153 family protein [Salifodinibacter halophilus]
MDPNKFSPLTRLFRRSPFESLTEHIRCVDHGADLLTQYLDASSAADWARAGTLYNEITDTEHRADELKEKVRSNLPNTLFLPISRSEILILIEAQDKIINKIKDIAGLMTGRQMQFPSSLEQPVRNYLQTSIDAVHQARKVLEELDELLESGFGRHVSEMIADMVTELGRLEENADQEQIAIRQQLLKLENELPALEVMFLYRVIDWIGSLSDRAEKVGGRLQILMAS